MSGVTLQTSESLTCPAYTYTTTIVETFINTFPYHDTAAMYALPRRLWVSRHDESGHAHSARFMQCSLVAARACLTSLPVPQVML